MERQTAPSAERNKEPILEVLRRVMPPRGVVLEIGSGTGQHVVHFAKALPQLTFQPSEMDSSQHASIRAWIAHEQLVNVRPPLAFDVAHLPWPVSQVDAIAFRRRQRLASRGKIQFWNRFKSDRISVQTEPNLHSRISSVG